MSTAMIYDFSASSRQARGGRQVKARVEITDALQRIERACGWLTRRHVTVLQIIVSTFRQPVVYVAAHPRVWDVFAGSAQTIGQRQDGALRYEVWEGADQMNNVTVRWEEVSACA